MEILRVMVHGWNPVHLVQCHQVCLIYLYDFYIVNIMPPTVRSVTSLLFYSSMCAEMVKQQLWYFFQLLMSLVISPKKV